MSIIYYPDHQVFKLDTNQTTYAFRVDEYGYLEQLHFGGRISDGAEAAALGFRLFRSFCPYPDGGTPLLSRDHMAQEYSTHAVGDYRTAAAIVRTADGVNSTDLKYVSHRIYSGKKPLPGLPASFATPESPAETLEIVLVDAVSQVEFILSYSVFACCDVIARSVRVVNRSPRPVYLEKVMSCCLALPNRPLDLITLDGSYARERHVTRAALRQGTQSVGSRRTSSSHQHNPAFMLADRTATEESGEAWGVCLVYSGSFLCEVELDQFNRSRSCAGIHPEDFEWELPPGGEFQAPEALLAYSDGGLSKLSHHFHDVLRRNLCRRQWSGRKRPVLVNNWEATYFDFNAEKLLNIAAAAAELGIEMMVLDDGWFGKRDDDRSSLGDWFVNAAKIGELGELVGRINALGIKFGLWFEPEMISENSELFRLHPEWVLTAPGRVRSLGRHQLVLNMAEPAVVDYLFAAISRILASANIEYVKWDMNRQPAEMYSPSLPPERQKELGHRYVLGVYELHRRLLEAFPELLIEGCSGGGGRFDAGMLYYAPQIWTSDNTDAIERLKIQAGTSLFYPASSLGAHVSACPNHQTGRMTPLETRGNVALAGTFGYEMDLATLNEAEREIVRRQLDDFHRFHPIIANGDLYRLTDPFGNCDYTAWEFVSKDGSEALLFYVVAHHYAHEEPRLFRLRGLQPERRYRVVESGLVLYGDTLMNAGLPMPEVPGDGASWHFQLKLVDKA